MTLTDKMEIIRKCKRAERPGLYIMVWLCLMNSCNDQGSRLRRIEEKLDRIGCVDTNAAAPRIELEKDAAD